MRFTKRVIEPEGRVNLTNIQSVVLLLYGMFALGCASYSIPLDLPQHANRRFGPWDIQTTTTNPYRGVRGAADALVYFYQQELRKPQLPNQNCPFYPSCSDYARTALYKYREVIGSVLIVDRLIVREHMAAQPYYPKIRLPIGKKLYDPVP